MSHSIRIPLSCSHTIFALQPALRAWLHSCATGTTTAICVSHTSISESKFCLSSCCPLSQFYNWSVCCSNLRSLTFVPCMYNAGSPLQRLTHWHVGRHAPCTTSRLPYSPSTVRPAALLLAGSFCELRHGELQCSLPWLY